MSSARAGAPQSNASVHAHTQARVRGHMCMIMLVAYEHYLEPRRRRVRWATAASGLAASGELRHPGVSHPIGTNRAAVRPHCILEDLVQRERDERR